MIHLELVWEKHAMGLLVKTTVTKGWVGGGCLKAWNYKYLAYSLFDILILQLSLVFDTWLFMQIEIIVVVYSFQLA